MEDKEKIKILQDLIQINSVNGNELEVAEYLHKLFAKSNLESKVDEFGDRRANLVLDVGQGEKVLGLTGHMDTVALGNEDKWIYPPLEAKIDGDRLYGRGAADMKSGLAALAIAIIELSNSREIPGHIRFIATAGEEYGTPGANRLRDLGVAKDLDALVVGEATNGDIIYAHSGSFNYRIVSHGKSVHSSTPELGNNALDALVDFAAIERTLFDDVPRDPYLGELKHSVTILNVGEQVNTIPDEGELYGNIRPTSAFNNKQIIERLKSAVDEVNDKNGAKLTFELIHDWYPVVSNPEDDFVQTALTVSQEVFSNYVEGKQPELITMNGATDASVFVKDNTNLPVIILGPGESNVSHQIDEYTTISSYLALVEIYKQIILRYFE
ncbi:ArgE/DapE family deacylase [Ligilactobacillus salivarius]|uniref:ArgE/DapE family deacylase n=1 Tax=Ligilactobacillus salivarius TaxID=1624 RepID=UPI0011CA719A|nr:ArgE/DapE family deacylase [Ligilactobacillus salivarius]TXJ75695.1 ArgE/DapE family deacylase [Ligilactobacillus salivarius]